MLKRRKMVNVFSLTLLLLLALLLLPQAGYAAPRITKKPSTSPPTATLYVQLVDSCREAVPGAFFELTGNGLDILAGPTLGTKPRSVGSGSCLIAHGNCFTVPTGCISFALPVPDTGTETYTITETVAPSGYAICKGGRACSVPETITAIIDDTGTISATVLNTYPDSTTVTWPIIGTYSGTQTDPVVPHNSRIGAGSCDGDNDADDHMSGSEGLPHCDNDLDA